MKKRGNVIYIPFNRKAEIRKHMKDNKAIQVMSAILLVVYLLMGVSFLCLFDYFS